MSSSFRGVLPHDIFLMVILTSNNFICLLMLQFIEFLAKIHSQDTVSHILLERFAKNC